MKVTKDDPRYNEEDEALMAGRPPRYVHRKPSKKAKQEYAVGEIVGASPASSILRSTAAQTAAATALTAAAPRIVRAVPKLLKAATAAQVSSGSLAGWLGTESMVMGSSGLAILAAAGLTSYFTTKWIMEHFSEGHRLDAALQAYLKSRRELAAKLGRPLTVPELQALNAHYQQVVREIKGA
jgi:hypothetical protein